MFKSEREFKVGDDKTPEVILSDEEIQAIDDSTHFHESFDWSIRFARNVLKAAEEKKEWLTHSTTLKSIV